LATYNIRLYKLHKSELMRRFDSPAIAKGNCMPTHVDLYDNAYAKVEHELYRMIRTETYGQDLGQTSWVNAEESELIPGLLKLNSDSNVLEVGCGSGLYAISVAKRLGCRVTGLDVNPHAIASATQLAAASTLDGAARFEQCDVSQGLPFADASFDAAFANDVLCHIPERPALLHELFRILRPGARLLFSDALIIGGVISHAEIAIRSSIGPYFFSPPGENERLLSAAGFSVVSVSDTSEQAAAVAKLWHDARERRREQLIALEGSDRYDGLQRFLACVHQLTSEGRLLRYVYLAEKS
jgi:ubiquinone/menaquinone biosynthesis C-methylase UbiE